MKKLLLYFCIIVLSTAGFAQESSLNIFSDDGDSFYLFLNGVRQNEQAAVNVYVDQLIKRNYDAKIVFADSNIPNVVKRYLQMVDVDGNHGNMTYKIKTKNNGKRVLRFHSFTELQQQIIVPDNVQVVHYNTEPMPDINYSVVNQTVINNNTTINNGDVHVNSGMGDVNIGIGVSISETQQNSTIVNQTSTGFPQEVVEVAPDCYLMSQQDFNDALKTINKKTFEDSKLTTAKQIARGNCLKSKQIKKIMQQFTYESTRLEFAKYAYPFCFNPENYWKVNDAFEYELTIDELNDFIGGE